MNLESMHDLVNKTNHLNWGDLVDAMHDLTSFLDSVIAVVNHNSNSHGVEVVRNNSPLLVDPDVVVIENMFQLHYLLKLPLTVTHSYGDVYQVTTVYKNQKFAEIINKRVYDEIYKDISTMVSEHEVFFPGR